MRAEIKFRERKRLEVSEGEKNIEKTGQKYANKERKVQKLEGGKSNNYTGETEILEGEGREYEGASI